MKKTICIVCLVIAATLAVYGQIRPGQRGVRRPQNQPPQAVPGTPADNNRDTPAPPTCGSSGSYVDDGWTSAEGRAMAARFPKKGSAAPVPSNQPGAVARP